MAADLLKEAVCNGKKKPVDLTGFL